MNIFLIGYRGTGKTTVGTLVARELDWSLVDADEELERRAGKTIAQIFADDGEQVFRDVESEVIAILSDRDQTVISLGGGAVMRSQNREAIVGRGHIVWLQADVETIAARVLGDESTAARRPNLTAKGGLQEIREILDERAPIYQQTCDWAVDTEGKTPEQVADEIVRWIRGSAR